MSLQVGAWCYADAAAAAAATCARHVPSTTVEGGNLVALSCSGFTEGGAVIMQTTATPVGSSASAVQTTHELELSYAECTQADVVGAGLAILAALLAAWAVWYGPWKITQFLRWGRSND